jgi:hypothetical protein
MDKMNVRRLMTIFSVISLLLLVSACGNSLDEAEESELSEVQREKLKLTIENMTYNAEKSEVIAEISTNLPDGIEVSAWLSYPEYAGMEAQTDATIHEGENTVLTFSLTEYTKVDLISGDYGIRLYVDVDGDDVNNPKPYNLPNDNKNEHMIHDSKVGGTSSELYDEYEDSETVDISRILEDEPYDEEDFNLFRYTITIRSENTIPLQTDISVPEEKEETQPDNESELSLEFLEYNKRYYQAYKNSLDLIGSNFELIHEGNYSSALIDDLITWTNEFNELLDVYEQNAIPKTDADQELYSITNEMIVKQREANKFILEGLKNNNGQPLVKAGEYLDSVADLYIKGNNLLEE